MLKKARNTFVTTVLLWSLVAPPAIAQSLFATIGDYGNGSTDEGNVAGLVSGWTPDFIITLGDNRYSSIDFDEAVGQFYCNFMTDAGSGSFCSGGNSPSNTFFPSLGNHDYTDGAGLNEYLDYFTLPGSGITTSGTSGSERYYDFIKGPVHFFIIDSQGALNSTSDKTTQMTWLQAQLAASSTPWQVVYFHHAPYSSGPHGSNPAMQWPFGAWGADAILSGHDHTYERILADGIVYFVNGLGGRSIYGFNTPVSGSQVRYNGDYGAMRVDASDTTITFEFINLSGSIIDSYTIVTGTTEPPQPIPQTGWSLLSVDSEDPGGYPAINAFDGNPSTFWHTQYHGGAPGHPHDIRIDLGGSYQLNGFRYLPRQDGSDNGRINLYEFYISNDGINWGAPITTGSFADNTSEQEALFATPVTSAFVRLVALSSYDGDPWTTIAEITVLGDQPPDGGTNVAPTAAFTYSCTDLDCSFSDGSSDDDGTVTAWAWDFGDGSTSTAQNPNHSYATTGTYTVSLTATDDDDATHNTSQSVTAIGTGESGTLDVRIAQSTDDVEEDLAGAMYITSSDLELGNDPDFNGDQTVGLRFQNVAIPQGAMITAAYLEFETDETGSSLTTVTIAAEATDNAAAFTSTNFNLTGRAVTLASVGWNIPAWGTINQKHQSPDLSTVVQEVVDRGGWSTNSNLAFIITGSGTRTAEAYDGEPAAAPLLHVEYTTGGGTNVAPIAVFTYSCTDLACDFADASTDSDGSVTAWSWDFGDGDLSNTANPSHTYAAAGTYNATLTVTDNNGDSDSVTQSVTVTAASLLPDAPTNLTASVQSSGQGKKKVVTGVQLNWSDNSSNEDVFIIEYCEETGKGKNKACNFAAITSVGANITSFSDSPGSGTHKYRVKARNAQGDSAYTNEVKI